MLDYEAYLFVEVCDPLSQEVDESEEDEDGEGCDEVDGRVHSERLCGEE